MARTVARGVRIGTTIRGARTVSTASGSPVKVSDICPEGAPTELSGGLF